MEEDPAGETWLAAIWTALTGSFPNDSPSDVGAEVKFHHDVGLVVAVVELERALVSRSGVPVGTMPAPYDFTWAFVLREQLGKATPLVVRERYGYSRSWAGFILEPAELISFG